MNPSAPNSFCNGLCVGVGKVERETHKAVACRHSLQLLCGWPDGEGEARNGGHMKVVLGFNYNMDCQSET